MLRFTVFICLLTFLLPIIVNAQDAATVYTSLDVHKRTQVRELGAALLMAKRSYEVDTDALQLREQIDNVRESIEALTQPLQAETITLVGAPPRSANLSVRPTGPANIQSDWYQMHEPQIQQLHHRLSLLRQQHDVYRQKQNIERPGLLQRFRVFLFGQQTHDTTTVAPVLMDISEPIMNRLNDLQAEIDAALAAEPAERHRLLLALSKDLRFKKKMLAFPVAETETPTYITRTQHR